MKPLIPSLIAALALTLFISPAYAQVADSLISGAGMPAAIPGFDVAAIPTWWLSGSFADCPVGVFVIFIFSLLASLLFFLTDAASRRV